VMMVAPLISLPATLRLDFSLVDLFWPSALGLWSLL
jgi:hypothetical protein